MGRSPNPILWQSWRERIARQLESDCSVAEFCARERVSLQSFYSWKRRLKSTRSSPTVATTSRSPRVTQRGSFMQVPLPVTSTPALIEFVLNSGTTVRVPANSLAAVQLVLASVVGVNPNEGSRDA